MSDLTNALENQCENLEKLLVSLDRELHFISSREPDELIKSVEEKTALLDTIQQTDQVIASFFQSGKPELSEHDQELMAKSEALLEKCKYNTAINQKAVEQGQLKLAHLRQLIMDVRAKESLTYDKSGQTKGGILGKGISA